MQCFAMTHASLAVEDFVMPAFKAHHHHKPSAHTLQLIKATHLSGELTSEKYILVCDSQDSRDLLQRSLSSEQVLGDDSLDSFSRSLQNLVINLSIRNLIILEDNLESVVSLTV